METVLFIFALDYGKLYAETGRVSAKD